MRVPADLYRLKLTDVALLAAFGLCVAAYLLTSVSLPGAVSLLGFAIAVAVAGWLVSRSRRDRAPGPPGDEPAAGTSAQTLVYRDPYTASAYWLDPSNPAVMLAAAVAEDGALYPEQAHVPAYRDVAPDLAAHHYRIHALLASRAGTAAFAAQLADWAAVRQAQAMTAQLVGQPTAFSDIGGARLSETALAGADTHAIGRAPRHARPAAVLDAPAFTS